MKTTSNSPEATLLFIVASKQDGAVSSRQSPVPERKFRLPLSDADVALILGKLIDLPDSISVVQKVVAQVFDVTVNQMIRVKRGRTSLSDPRMFGMAICDWAGLGSQPTIEARFHRTHGSVINARTKVSGWISDVGRMRAQYHQILVALVHECRQVGILFLQAQGRKKGAESKVFA